MIVVDASALIAVMQNEPEADGFLAIIRREDRVLAPAVMWMCRSCSRAETSL
jgi:uncharacterized protein with PIN domain